MAETAGMNIGTAYLEIVPSARGFSAALNKQVADQVKSVSGEQGVSAGKSLGKAFMDAWAAQSKREGATVRDRILGVINDPEATRAASTAGSRIGGQIGKMLTLGLRDSTKGLSKEIGDQVSAANKEAEKATKGRSFGNMMGAGAAFGAGGAAIAGVISLVRSYAGQATEAADATLKFQNTLKFAGIKPDQIKTVTDQTQKYADQTVYSLSDIQSMTAQLASNGVKNYEGLAEAAGNLNAVAGGNADTFKSVGMVMTQTAGAGKLTTDNWNQLADAIPGASGKLQEALLKNGAYTGNFRDAMQKGQISAEEFNKAVMQLGSTDIAKSAATSTTTFEGAWGNLQASLVGGLSKLLTTIRPIVTAAMGLLANIATPVFSAVNKALQFVIDGLSKLGGLAKGSGILGSFTALGSRISGVFQTIKQDISDFVAGVTLSDWSEETYGDLDGFVAIGQRVRNAFLVIKGAISDFIAGVTLSDWSEETYGDLDGFVAVGQNVRNEFLRIKGAVVDFVKGATLSGWSREYVASVGGAMGAGARFRGALESVVNWFKGTLVPAYLSYAGVVRNLAATVLSIAGQIASGLMARIRPLLPQIRQVFSQIGSAVTAYLGLMREVIVRVTELIQAIWRRWGTTLLNFAGSTLHNILTVVSGVLGVIKNVFLAVTALLQGHWGAFWRDLLNIAKSLGRVVQGVVAELWTVLKGAFFTGIAALRLAWTGLWDFVKSVASSAWHWFTSNVGAPIIHWFTSTIQGALGKFRSGFSSVWNSIKAAAAKPVNFVINTVWNNGLRKALNLIPGVNMGAASPIPGFRKGGYTGNVGRDTVAGVVHGNEFVMDAETTRLGGGRKGMERIRRALRSGGVPEDIFDVVRRGPKGPAGQGGPSEDAISRGYALAHDGEDWHERCLNFVNRAWGTSVPRLMVATAMQSARSGPVNMTDVPPPGAVVYGNTSANGHAMLSIGGGQALSTDWGGRGKVGIGGVGEIFSAWHAPYMGWWHPILGTGGGGGGNIFGKAWGKAKGAAKWVGGKAVGAADWLGNKAMWVGHEAVGAIQSLFNFNPVKALINKVKGAALSGLNATPFGKVIAKSVPTIFGKAMSWAENKAKSVLSFGSDSSSSPVSGSGPAAFEGWWKQAVSIDPSLAPYHNAATIIAKNESGFNPNAVNNWDSNARAGHPSKGLMQFIEATFQRYAYPGHTNWMSPVDQLLAWRRYTDAAYGSPNNTPGLKSLGMGRGYIGYANGTDSASPGWHWVGENGPELLRFRGGEQVMDNRRSMQVAARGGAGQVNNFYGPVGAQAHEVVNAIRDENAREQARSGLRYAMAGL